MVTRQTHFSDVCGTMDEFKRLHGEEYERVLDDHSALLPPLLEDARYMLLRMQQRIGEYDDYRARVASALRRMDEEPPTDTGPAERALALLDNLARSQDDYAATGVPEIADLAEEIRSVASSLEHELRARMELALELHKLFIEIKRDRPWVLDDADTGSYKEQVEAKYQSWLPVRAAQDRAARSPGHCQGRGNRVRPAGRRAHGPVRRRRLHGHEPGALRYYGDELPPGQPQARTGRQALPQGHARHNRESPIALRNRHSRAHSRRSGAHNRSSRGGGNPSLVSFHVAAALALRSGTRLPP